MRQVSPRENYDKTLVGWAGLPNLQNNVVFDAGRSQYCEAIDSRQAILDTYGWTITDGGESVFCSNAATAIKAYVLTPGCVDSSDGAIEITSEVPGLLMDIVIEGDHILKQFNDITSDDKFRIGNLVVGRLCGDHFRTRSFFRTDLWLKGQ